jgi:acylphosphatase
MNRIVALHVVIRGDVQGVGYRASMQSLAAEAGLTGWVRNRRDGTVEAYVQGDAQAVERIVAWCRRGPPAARVTSIEAEAVASDDALRTFEQRGTA